MANVASYLLAPSGNYTAPVPNVWVGLWNNLTGIGYKSTAATDSQGFFTVSNVPDGTYTVYTSLTGTGVPPASGWTPTSNTQFVVTQTDGAQTPALISTQVDAALGSLIIIPTMAASGTLGVPLNPLSGQELIYQFTQNGTGGWTVTAPGAFANFPAIVATANAVTYVGVKYNGTSWQPFAAYPVLSIANSVVNTALGTSGDGAGNMGFTSVRALIFASGLTGGGFYSNGSGAPSKPGNVNPVFGDAYDRTDTAQRHWCIIGGATPTWAIRTRQTPAFNAAPAPDPTLGEIYQMANLTGAVAVANAVNALQGHRIRFYWVQDGTGGRAVTYPGTNWRAGGLTAQVTTASTVTIDDAECVDGTIWRVGRIATGQAV